MDYNWMVIKKDIKKFALNNGIDRIGFTTADPFWELKKHLLEKRRNNYHCEFEEKDIEKRTNPKLILPQAQSIISVALAYPSVSSSFGKNGTYQEEESQECRGEFCRASWGEDYHLVLKKRLTILAEYIKKLFSEAETVILVDTGPLSDRAVAERAGLGWIGKNTNLIVPGLGSWVFLGEIVTNLPFPPDQSLKNQCGSCRLCLDSCPNHALLSTGQINAKGCLSYLSQTKHPLDEAVMIKLGNVIYGCDRCQLVCPYNKDVNFEHHEEFKPSAASNPVLKNLLQMTNKEFKQSYGHLAGAWRGKTPIQRNAIIALANLRDQSAVPILTKLLQEDPRQVIRETAAWALDRLKKA